MFDRKKKSREDANSMPQSWTPLPPRVPTFREQLCAKRMEKIAAANDLDREIAGLDGEDHLA